jgi:hypothetical protein
VKIDDGAVLRLINPRIGGQIKLIRPFGCIVCPVMYGLASAIRNRTRHLFRLPDPTDRNSPRPFVTTGSHHVRLEVTS